jgi:hypothetical protein
MSVPSHPLALEITSASLVLWSRRAVVYRVSGKDAEGRVVSYMVTNDSPPSVGETVEIPSDKVVP